MAALAETASSRPASSPSASAGGAGWLQRVASASALLVAASGLLALVGWSFGSAALKSLGQPVPMNPTTALCLLLCAGSLWLRRRPSPAGAEAVAGRVMAGVVAAVGAAKLAELAVGHGWGVDTLLFRPSLAGNRIAPNTAMALLLAGAGLALLDARGRRGRGPGALLLLAALAVALLAVAGYVYAVFGFYGVSRFTPMALNSALALTVLCAGGLCARPGAWPVAAVLRGWSLRQTVAAGYVAALAMLCLIGFVSYNSTRSLISFNHHGDQRLRAVNALDSVLLALRDAEASLRGFLLTGEEPYLEPYVDATAGARRRIEEAKALVGDSPGQQQRLRELGPAVEAKLAELAETIRLRREKGPDAALAVVKTGRGRALMVDIRRRLAALQGEEAAHVTEKLRQESQLSVRTLRTIVAGTSTAFALVALAGLLIRRGIAAQQRAERELERAKLAAEAASEAKSSFLANMSHEIRTPMAAIIGHADLLLDPQSTPSDRLNSVNSIRRSGQHLLTVINDILDLSKIEAGKMTVERVECDPCHIVADVASLMRPRAQEKKLRFDVRFETPLPRAVPGDPTRLRQVLINLVGNAVKFTRAGSVRVVLRLDDAPGHEPVLRFEVQDTGVGMTPEQVARVFRPFAQGDDTMTRQFGGTGLGLTICRRLARLMGGDIELDTGPDSGSRFTLVLPTGPLQSTAMISDPAEAARSAEVSPNDTAAAASLTLRGRVLLAEDGPENQIIIGAYLRRAGAEVVIANDGREAVEMARRERFDVILMDMQMPHLDGYGAASKLRALGLKVPIVALTAHAMSEDKDKCLNAGCTDYLSKPVDRGELVATIHRHIVGARADVSAQPTRAPAAAAAAPGVSIEGRPTIDDPVLREYLPEFVAQLPGHVREMEAMLAARDLAELAKHVHQLRGAGGMYGYPQITTAAAEAERRVNAQEPLEAVRQGVEELVRLVRSVEGYDRKRETAETAVGGEGDVN